MITVNFAKKTGKMRPMHCTNNGPVYKFAADQRITNLDAFKEAGIPYARTHDASFYSTYGGEQDRKSTRLNSSHITRSRMPSSA